MLLRFVFNTNTRTKYKFYTYTPIFFYIDKETTQTKHMKSISFESIGMILLLMLFVLFCCIILVLIKIVARNCVCMFLFRCMVFSFVECSHSRLRTGKIAFLCSWTEWSTNTWLYKTMFNRTISAVASSVCHLCPSEYRQSKYQRT